MSQPLLFPDPKPLVERLGSGFFRQAPETPGVYLMRDAADAVVYVGKAKNLRQRLSSYRVANPDRLRQRHLRLLNSVARIELQECPTEAAALAREAELLRSLRPKFNRAGTWPASPRHLLWRASADTLELGVAEAVEPGWSFHGPMGAGAFYLRAALTRLLWCVLQPELGLVRMPAGWFQGNLPPLAVIAAAPATRADLPVTTRRLEALFQGQAAEFASWIAEKTAAQNARFETAARETDLESLLELRVKSEALPT